MILFLLQVIFVIVILLLLHYLIFTWDPNYFKRLGVPGPYPWPLLGALREMMKKGFLETDYGWAKQYGRVFGIFEGTTPLLMISDPDLLQLITVKRFNSFTNRRSIKTDDHFIDFQLGGLKDEHWRHVRRLMSPAFSTSRLKGMSEQINGCGALLEANIEKAIAASSTVDIKGYAGAFTMDVIAKTAFGIEVDSQQNKDNPFVYHAHKSMNQNFFRPAILIGFFFPFLRPLLKTFNMSFFPPDSRVFFGDIVSRLIDGRMNGDSSKHTSQDFLQLIMNSHKELQQKENDEKSQNDGVVTTKTSIDGTVWTDKGLTREELEAQSILFLLAAFDTTASTIAFFLYCMALNPDCQERLYKEITNKFGEKTFMDYDSINELEYLDMCLQETLRAYPPGIRVDRVASEEVATPGLTIPKGQLVGLQIYALHHDPHYWPNPDKYDPERFTKEARESHHPYQFMPFGAGPRICIGMRLALLEVKVAVSYLIRRFRFSRCDQTEVPIKFNNGSLLQPLNGVKLNIEKRS